VPSTAKQLVLLDLLVQELRRSGSRMPRDEAWHRHGDAPGHVAQEGSR
jgi:hypothetical protein